MTLTRMVQGSFVSYFILGLWIFSRGSSVSAFSNTKVKHRNSVYQSFQCIDNSPYIGIAGLLRDNYCFCDNVNHDFNYLTIRERTEVLLQHWKLYSSRPNVIVDENSGPIENNESSKNHKKKRKKQNKYEKFSKTSLTSLDPLELLLEESKLKNEQLLQEQQVKLVEKHQFKQKIVEQQELVTSKIEFPDTKAINPYDPQTFGYIEIGTLIGAHGVQGWVKLKGTSETNGISDTILEQQKRRVCLPGLRHIKAPSKRAPRQIFLVQGKYRTDQDYIIQLEGIDNRDVAQSYKGSKLYIRQEQVPFFEEDDRTNKINNDPFAIEQEEYDVAELVGLNVYLYISNEMDDYDFDDKSPDDEDSNDLEDDHTNQVINEDEYFSKQIFDENNVKNDQETVVDQYFIGRVNGIVFAEDICDVPGLLTHDFIEIVLPRGASGTFSLMKDELVLIPFVPQLVPIVDLVKREMYIDPPAGLLDLTYVRSEKSRIKAFLPSSASISRET